jgi:trimethylamine--corrinoid protein Co-methyltransferase
MPITSPARDGERSGPAAITPGAGRWNRMSADGCAQLQAAACAILERTGVRVDHPEARRLLAAAGARVDAADRVRIPAALVAEALAVAPKALTLHDRLGRPAIAWGGETAWFGPGSDCPYVVDGRTGERRLATLDDLRAGIALVDALPNLAFAMSIFLPSDVDGRAADRHQAVAMLTGTTKPLIVVTYELDGLRDVLAMAEAVAGGAGELAARPSVAWYINVTRGLLLDADALGRLLFLAERGLPALWIPVTSGGTTGPVTVAGTLAVNHAGVLAGLVIAQLVREGAPVVVPGFGGDALDLRTTVDPYVGPDPKGAAEALAHHLGLPMFSLGGGADSKVVDGQAAAEAAAAILLDALAAGQVTHDSGYLESGLAGSLPQLAICDELVGWTRAATSPLDLSAEALALDLVDAVGPEGSFLEADHTLAHYRSRWYPSLFDRRSRGAWAAAGGQALGARAADRVDAILAGHAVPPPLPEAASTELREIVARAEARAGL